MGDAKNRKDAAKRTYTIELTERDRIYLLTFFNAVAESKDHTARRLLNRSFDQLDMDTVERTLRGPNGRNTDTFKEDVLPYEITGDVLEYLVDQLDLPVVRVSAYVQRTAGQVRDRLLDVKNAPDATTNGTTAHAETDTDDKETTAGA